MQIDKNDAITFFNTSLSAGLSYGALNSGATLATNLLMGRATYINLAQAGLNGFLFGSTVHGNRRLGWTKASGSIAEFLVTNLNLPEPIAIMIYLTISFIPNAIFATCAPGIIASSFAISYKAAACYGLLDIYTLLFMPKMIKLVMNELVVPALRPIERNLLGYNPGE